MSTEPSIFVQIPAYRDLECIPTIVNMLTQAAIPQRVHIGVCWQYKQNEESDLLEIPDEYTKQVRYVSFPVDQSKGVTWARNQAQQLYNGEDYTLMIDSHMRFVSGWDELLITQLKACDSKKPVLTYHPSAYTPPDKLEKNPKLTILRADYPNAAGEIRLRGEVLDIAPSTPLHGAFASPALLFASAKLLDEVPSDPYLYFEQEEICFSARLFTQGWDVFHPCVPVAYHLYEDVANSLPRAKHWNDCTDWQYLNKIASARRGHLFGHTTKTPEALEKIKRFGLGKKRSLKEYEKFSGIDFSNFMPYPRALNGEFITNLTKYRITPINIVKKPTDVAISKKNTPIYTRFADIPISNFKPSSTDILKLPNFHPAGLYINDTPPTPKIITDGVPNGVLVIENYASPALCRYLIDYCERTSGTKLQVVDADKSSADKIIAVDTERRITESVSINGVAAEILGIFLDVYVHRLAPYFGVKFEWFERPQILRYRTGGRYDPHADSEQLEVNSNKWVRVQDRDISVLLYLNEDYEGGAISFDNLDFSLQPKSGMLLAFPSDHRYLHTAHPTTKGTRYVIVSWASTIGTARVMARHPYAATLLNLSE